jgi:hypothetical protein
MTRRRVCMLWRTRGALCVGPLGHRSQAELGRVGSGTGLEPIMAELTMTSDASNGENGSE